MKNANWKDVAELLGIAAIVASLIFVGLQLRQSEQLGLSESMSNLNQRTSTIREQIIANAGIWRRACLGEELDDDSQIIAARIAEAYWEHFVTYYLMFDQGIVASDAGKQQVVGILAYQLWRYPGLRELVDSWIESQPEDFLFTPDFIRMVRESLEELDLSGRPPVADPAWCGRT